MSKIRPLKIKLEKKRKLWSEKSITSRLENRGFSKSTNNGDKAGMAENCNFFSLKRNK